MSFVWFIEPINIEALFWHRRTISGPMLGTEGVVTERKDAKARMVLEVTILGQGAVVEIDSDLLEPMG